MIHALYVLETKNVGDLASSPVDYFDFSEVRRQDVRFASVPKDATVILGGGSVITAASFDWKRTIGWGVGHTVRAQPWHEEMVRVHREAAAQCDLYFPRDEVPGFDVVPCASCMHPAFDVKREPSRKEVRYSAARRVNVHNGKDPHMTNEDGTIEEAVAFLASGEKVVTSSYHGAYWAMLLGRQVSIVSWGSKFHYLPKMTLEECRAANRRAYAKTLELLS